MLNVELKALYPDLEKGQALARELGAAHRGLLVQTDTYFQVRFGRLKLREIEGASEAELIAYHRKDEARARNSDYEIVKIIDPEAAKRALARTLGIKVIVKKERDLWIWRNVRIHLDRVEHLGGYIEFEAVLQDASESEEGRREVGNLAAHFGVDPGKVQTGSYAELLIQSAR